MRQNASVATRVDSVKPKRIPVADLDLDPLNPRLIVASGVSQAELTRILYEEEALDELFPSFIENGYFEEEPLVVVPNGTRFTVVEGNRRLATLKLLLDRSLRRRVQVTGWPVLSSKQTESLRIIPCVVYGERKSVIPFLGYRHITGAKKWAPFQKARFVAQLLDSGTSLEHIQEVIGDTTQATKKLYQNYLVYQQIIDDLPISAIHIRERFSLLEVILGQRPIKRYLGMSMYLPREVMTHPIPEDHLDQLQDITVWVFGDGDRKPIISDSRDISRRLAKVIDNDDALEHLRLTGDLEGAYERTGGEQQYLLRRLAAGERAVRDSAGLLALYGSDEEVRSAVQRLVALIEGLKRQTSS
jgi:ParB-like nuclease domain